MTAEEVGVFTKAQNNDEERAHYTMMERLLIKCERRKRQYRKSEQTMKRVIPALCLCAVMMVVLLASGCSRGVNNKVFSTLADFDGAKVGSLTGAVFAKFIDPVVPNVQHQMYNSTSDTAAALSAGKIDAMSLDMPVAMYLVAQNNSLALFPEVVAEDRYGFAVTKDSMLAVQGNTVLEMLRENGTLDEVKQYWFSAGESEKSLPELTHKTDFDGSAGTIRYGCDTTLVPMSYIGAGGETMGLDLDVIRRVAYELNMNIEFVPMNFDALLTSLAAGKADVVGGTMSITEERMKSVDFIGPYFEGGIVFVVKADRLSK